MGKLTMRRTLLCCPVCNDPVTHKGTCDRCNGLIEKRKEEFNRKVAEQAVTEFLVQSNYIEGERSPQAHADARRAWNFLNTRRVLQEDLLLSVHRILMCNLDPSIAGQFRTIGVSVGGRICPHWSQVTVRIEALMTLYPKEEEEIKKWHIVFEKIHPFVDGNGRVGRILMNWQRVKSGLPVLVIHEGEEQQEYYGWFNCEPNS